MTRYKIVIEDSAGELIQKRFNTFTYTVPIRWFYALNSLQVFDMTKRCTVRYTFHSPVVGEYKANYTVVDHAYHDAGHSQLTLYNPTTAAYIYGIVGPKRLHFYRGWYLGLRPTPDYQCDTIQESYVNNSSRKVRTVTMQDFELDLEGGTPHLAATGDMIAFHEEAFWFSFVGNGDQSVNRDKPYPADIEYGQGKAKENGCTFYFEFLMDKLPLYDPLQFAPPADPTVVGIDATGYNMNGFASSRPRNNGVPYGCIPILYHFPESNLRLVVYAAVISTEHAQLFGTPRLSINVIICDDTYVYCHRGFIDRGLNLTSTYGQHLCSFFVTLGIGNGRSTAYGASRPNMVNIHFFHRGPHNTTFRHSNPGGTNTPFVTTPFQSNINGWYHPWMSGTPVPPGLGNANYECTPEAELLFRERNNHLNKIDIYCGDIQMGFPPGYHSINNIYTLLRKCNLDTGEGYFPGTMGSTEWLYLRRTVMLRNNLLNLSEMEEIYRSTFATDPPSDLYSWPLRTTAPSWANFDRYYAHKIVDIDYRYRDQNLFYADSVDRPPGTIRFTMEQKYNKSSIAAPGIIAIDHREGGFLSLNNSAEYVETMQLSELPARLEVDIVHESNDSLGDELYIAKPTIEIDLELN